MSFREGAGDISPGLSVENETSGQRKFTQPYVSPTNMTAAQAGAWILEHTPTTFQRMMETNYSNGIEYDEEKLIANDDDPRMWSNPLESRCVSMGRLGTDSDRRIPSDCQMRRP